MFILKNGSQIYLSIQALVISPKNSISSSHLKLKFVEKKKKAEICICQTQQANYVKCMHGLVYLAEEKPK